MNSAVTTIESGDNFIYVCGYDRSSAFVVDPSDSSPVLRTISERSLSLTTVLVTHDHWDHVAGIRGLKERTGCRVIGGDKQRVPAIDSVVGGGEVLSVGDVEIQVIATPGHTRTSLCYYMQPSNDSKSGAVWTGDTLFIGGCGRLLECGPQSMFDSLLKLASLPDQTLVYCGHDYTLENYEFALTVEPDNQAVNRRLQEVRQAVKAGRQTVPSTISEERITNPFLRAGTPELKTALSMPQAEAVEVFAELRRRKDVF
ncbi:MAG: hydroxyacylglutathione hydrolase [Planctomycetota bacterium]|jgi:hydroxyacylglutathione hydrolase